MQFQIETAFTDTIIFLFHVDLVNLYNGCPHSYHQLHASCFHRALSCLVGHWVVTATRELT